MGENTTAQMQPETDFFRSLTDLLPEAFLLVEADGAILSGNQSAARLFSRKGFRGETLSSLVSDCQAKVSRILRMWLETGSMTPAAFVLPSKSILRCDGARISGVARPLILVRCVVRTESFASREFVRHSVDYLNGQKNIAEKLAIAKQQKEAAETTAAMFAHEIANPLNGLSTTLDVLQLEIGDSLPVQELLGAAREEIKRMVNLLNEFRALARPYALDLRITELNQLVEEVMTPELPAVKRLGIKYETCFDTALPAVLADRNRLKQAILNICKNSVEAMPQGGRIRISTKARDNIIELEIEDTGSGIPKDIDPFQIFKTTKAAGTGLGLPVAAQIVASHKGRIKFQSEVGRGTTFTISLPAAKTADRSL